MTAKIKPTVYPTITQLPRVAFCQLSIFIPTLVNTFTNMALELQTIRRKNSMMP